MLTIPNWDDLSEEQRNTLFGLASTFGVNILTAERIDGSDFVLLSEDDAKCAALEMFVISRGIIMDALGLRPPPQSLKDISDDAFAALKLQISANIIDSIPSIRGGK